MTHYGKISNYDTTTGAGFIMPDKGGDRVPFARDGLKEQGQAQAPHEQDRFAYDLGKDTAGESCAVNLRRA
jgi:cold shock protein